MEAVDFNKAPQGATHFLRYDSGYVVWCCVVEDGPNGLPIVKEWDSFNEYWVPAIHGADYYYSIGMQWIEAPAPAPQAPAQPEAPKGATHRYEHAGLVSWYREVDGNMFTWRDGSWFASFFKSAQDLAQSCMLAKVTPLVADTAQQVDDDLTWLVRETKGEWFGSSTHIARDGADGYWWARAPRPRPEQYGWFTKEQYLARRAELQNKPSWKDAPEWGEWLAQDEDGEWKWLAGLPGKYVDGWTAVKIKGHCKGLALGDWRDTLEKRPEEFKPFTSIEDNQDQVLTQQQDNGWLERAELPPVGIVCEAYIDRPPQWIEAEIVAHKDGFAIGWCKSVMKGCHGDKASEFRPIRTERDKLVELIKTYRHTFRSDTEFADAILAAGFKRGAA